MEIFKRACTDRVIGVLVECDPSIKALIVKIDSDHHDIVIQVSETCRFEIDSLLTKLLGIRRYTFVSWSEKSGFR